MLSKTYISTYMQVTVEYKKVDGACIPQRIHTVVISVQHSEDVSLEEMRRQLKDIVIKVNLNILYKSLYVFQVCFFVYLCQL